MATRAILLYTINGDVGDLDASDARLDLLDSTLTWHDQRAMEVELHWITPLKSSLIKIVRRLRELRRRVMESEWSVGEDGKHGKEATSSLGGTVGKLYFHFSKNFKIFSQLSILIYSIFVDLFNFKIL